ncbi:MAG: HEAT repeat domain-containing protein [Bacteroidota bacterium]
MRSIAQLYRILVTTTLRACLLVGLVAVFGLPAFSLPSDSLANKPAEDFKLVKEKTGNAFERAKEAFSHYQPSGKSNPISRELLRVVFYFMASFVVCIFLMLILIVVNRIRQSWKTKKHAELKHAYENILVELLYSRESEPEAAYLLKPAEELKAENEADAGQWLVAEAPTAPLEVKASPARLADYFEAQELTKRFNRHVLVELILELHKNLSGATANTLRNLYIELGFDEDAKRALKRSNWSDKAKAVRELSQMGISEAEPAITKLLNHASSVLVLEVQIAHLKLNRETPFSFLDNTEVEITDWQQVSLLAMISHSPHFKIPDFSRWLSSPNDSVVLFVTKMVNYYNQLDASDKLIALLSHPNEKVRLEVIKSLGELEVAEAEQALINIYPTEPEGQQVAILIALGRIGTANAVIFLNNALQSPQFALVFNAAKGLLLAGQPGMDVLTESAKGDSDLQRIIKHLKDERI